VTGGGGPDTRGYVETWYRARLADPGPRPPLSGQLDADVCVVGGGLAGLTAALELARAGRAVCLLEANRVGWGASGRNGGFVSPGFSAGHDTLAQAVGEDHARALHRLSIEGMDAIADNLDRLAIAGADRVHGILSASRHEAAGAMTAQRDRLARDFDYPVEFWPREQVQAALLSPRYFQGLYQPRAFHIDPLAYARALAGEIERLGGRVFEGSAVTALGPSGAAQRVVSGEGEVIAKDVVIATGGYTGRLSARLHGAYLPIATYVMLTKAEPTLIATAIRTPAAIGDRRRAGDYYRLVDGGRRILWGGKITTRTGEPRRLADLLRRTMIATYPQLADLEVDIAWSGLMAYARHLMPQIGPLGPGLWCCTAFGGHGLNTTAIGGRLVAEAITGASDRWRLFAPFGLAWNGGPAGRMAVQATYWTLQMQDWLNELRR
jgi:gamma-glutamylputrescine oxidase